MNNRKGTTVRLTEDAHQLLAEKAKDLGDSMKELATEAIFCLVRNEEKDKEIQAMHSEPIWLRKEDENRKRFVLCAFILGAIVSACGAYLVVVL